VGKLANDNDLVLSGINIVLKALEAPIRQIAGLLITTEAMVAEIPKKEAAPAIPGGGMGGMDY
jgi:chaperonin GroEL